MTQAAGTLRGHGTGKVYASEGGWRSALLMAKSLFVLTKPRIIEPQERAAYDAYLVRLNEQVKGHGRWHGLR